MILIFWDKAIIPCKLKRNLIPTIEKLVDEYKKLRKNKENKQKRSEGLQEKEDRFSDDLDNLFDVAHANALSLIKIEEDRLFLSAQREKGRRGTMGTVDAKLARSEKKARNRQEAEIKKREAEEERFHQSSEKAVLGSSSKEE